VDSSGLRLCGDACRLLDDVAATDDETGSQTSERPVEIRKRVEKKRNPVRRPERREDLRIQHEQGDDSLRLSGRSGEGRVVVHSEVPREEDEGSLHAGCALIGTSIAADACPASDEWAAASAIPGS
jgi:hypothetical protein